MSTLTTSVPQSGPIPEGCRTETLFQLAEDMFLRGYGTDAVFDALIYDNRTRCQPPLGYAALQQIAAAAVRSFAVNRGFTLLESAWPDQIAQAMLEKAKFPVRYYDGCWMILSEGRYVPVEAEEIRHRIYQFGFKCKVRTRLSSDDLYVKLRVTPTLVDQVLESLSLTEPVCIDHRLWPPVWLNDSQSRPLPDDIIAVHNALIDISGGHPVRMDPAADYFTMTCLPIAYDPKADCPVWRQKLSEWFQGDPEIEFPDTDSGLSAPCADTLSIAILQEWFGLAVAGKCYGPRMLGIAGPAQSGKSTIAYVFYALLGASNTLSLTVPQRTGRYGLDNLARKRAAVIHSVCLNRKDSKTRRAIESLSRFCNQDFWQLNGRQWPIKINTRLMLIADNLSDLVDSEGVLSGDITRLETTQSFSGRQDIYLKEKLNAELPGIFNWALEGFFRVQARGRFQASLIDQTFGIESRTADCQPGLFIQHCCRKADDARISCAQLYETYKRWSIRRGGVPLGRTGFYQAVAVEYPDCTRTKMRLNGSDSNPQWVFEKLALQSTTAPEDGANPDCPTYHI